MGGYSYSLQCLSEFLAFLTSKYQITHPAKENIGINQAVNSIIKNGILT